MAAPHVTGAGALVLSYCAKHGLAIPNAIQIAAALRGTTQNFSGRHTPSLGYGQPLVAIERAPGWPRPPRCLVAADLVIPPNGARVAVAGLVVCRQRPGTAKGVIFVTLEDETGTANVVVWARTFERFRRAVIAGPLPQGHR